MCGIMKEVGAETGRVTESSTIENSELSKNAIHFYEYSYPTPTKTNRFLNGDFQCAEVS